MGIDNDELIDFLGKLELLSGKNTTIERLKKTIRNFDNFNQDCLSWGQLRSKKWLLDELSKINLNFNEVLICAGWYGLLAHMLFTDDRFRIKRICSVDLDPNTEKIADCMNFKWLVQNWRFKSVIKDINEIDYNNICFDITNDDGETKPFYFMPDLIINTSCEHIQEFDKWIVSLPKNKLCVLQSNNYFVHHEHVNCVSSNYELEKKSKFTKIYFSGELKNHDYTRYMVIGEK